MLEYGRHCSLAHPRWIPSLSVLEAVELENPFEPPLLLWMTLSYTLYGRKSKKEGERLTLMLLLPLFLLPQNTHKI